MTDKSKALPEFEKALSQLETLVEKLEKGDMSLDDSLSHFKQGVTLTQQCQQILEQAQLTVEQLVGDGDTQETAPFDPDD